MKKRYSIILFIASLLASVVLCFALSSCGCQHANREWVMDIAPTYARDGIKKQICKDCGAQTSTYSLPAFAGNANTKYYEEISIIEPTCTQGGRKKYIYQSGDMTEVFESDVPPLEHSYATEGTSKDEAYHTVYCECGASKDVAHLTGNFTGEESTCTKQGFYYVRCYYCDLEMKKPFQLLPHSYEDRAALEATCKTQGNTAGKECTDCGHKEGYEVLPIVDCSFDDGFCRWCTAKLVYRVTYVNGESSETVEFGYGDKFDDRILPHEIYRAFLGWYNEDGTVKYNSQSALEVNMTVYAKWEDAIAISTAQDFLAIAESSARSFYLTNDINLKGETIAPIDNFSGTLNGCGYAVKNFSVNTTSLYDYQGLFRVNEGRISDITFADYTFNINIANAQGVLKGAGIGALVGLNKGTLDNIEIFSSSISTTVAVSMPKGTSHSILIHIGGIVGINEGKIEALDLDYANNVILNLYNGSFGISGDACDIDMTFNVGKVCGYNKGDIVSVWNTGLFSIDVEQGRDQHDLYTTCNIGGVIGRNDGKATRSFYDGKITYSKDSSHVWLEHEYAVIGGFVGLNYGEISESYAVATIDGGCEDGYKAGGFVGINDETAKISSCYAECTLNLLTSGSNYVGGFVGVNDALIQSSYSGGFIESHVSASVGGFAGLNDTGGTINRSYTKTAITATSGTCGRFTSENRSIITKSNYIDGVAYVSGSSTEGTMAITTDIKAISIETLVNETFLCDIMYWNEEGWYVDGENEPVLEWTRSNE